MKKYFSSTFTLGVLGGGQLGRMLLPETNALDIRTSMMDPAQNAPCAALADEFRVGDLKDYNTVYVFGKTVDLLTIEIEHVNVDALERLEKEGLPVRPSSQLIRTIQDKSIQKAFYIANDIPTAGFLKYQNKAEVSIESLTFPCVQKAAKEGYDGRGVNILSVPADWEQVPEGPGIIEEFISEAVEIAVQVARNPSGEIKCHPPVEMEFHPKANLVEYIACPAAISPEMAKEAETIAIRVAEAFDLEGLLAVEMFVTKEGRILVNESAPRTHNSGHLTIENNTTSQFAQHLRAILDLPLGGTELRSPAVMINLLGEDGYSGAPVYQGMEEVLAKPGVYVHLYGKKDSRPFRKMGHVTITGTNQAEIREKAIFVQQNLKVIA